MRHYRKILGVIAFVLVTAVVAAIVAVRFLPETDLIRHSLRDRLSALSGHNVRLGALRVSMSFPSLLNLTLEGVSVSSKAGKSLLQAGTIEFSPSLTSLFSGQVSIESVVIRRLRVEVRRAQDGRVENPFVPDLPSRPAEAGLKSPSPKEEPPSAAPPGEGLPAEKTPTRDLDQRVKWSINTVKLVDARVELIDREIVPGEPARTSLDNINCTFHRQKTGNSFALNLDAELIGGHRAKSPIRADGTITMADDFSRLILANVAVSLKSLDLKGLQDYVPPWARVMEQFDVASSHAEITWKSDDDARIAFKIDVSGKSKEAPQLKFQGVAVMTRDFSTLREIRGTGESDRLPLRLFSLYLPKEFPLDSKEGTLKASVEGRWASGSAWALQGNVGLEEAVPAGRFKKIARKVRIWSQSKLTPDLLHLDSLEISSSTTLAALSGTITAPLADNREFDLEGRVNLDPAWLGALGVKLPKNLTIQGTIPIQGRGRGKRERLWVDLAADVTSTAINWAPYVEKSPGNKGTVSIKGNFLSPRSHGGKREVPEAEVRAGLSGATVRVRPDGPRLPKCSIEFASKVLFNSGGADFKGATLALRRGSGVSMIARADVRDAGTESAGVTGNATLNLNRTTLALIGLDLPRGVEIIGNTELRTGIKGSMKALDWSVDIPLTHLDLQVDGAFRKPGGVKGAINASGKWALEELTMTAGKLTLPGLTVTGNGSLRDKTGKFRGLTLTARNAELKQMAKLLPSLSDKGFSGEVDFTVHLRPSNKGVSADGKARLLKVDYRPPNAAWKIENVRGTLESDGSFLESSGVTGEIKGPVEGPLTVKGKLSRIQSLDTMSGRVSLNMGKGRIQTGRLQRGLGKARAVLDALVRPGDSRTAGDRLEFESAAGSITIGSGIAKTEDIQMKGRDLTIGAMGSCRLKTTNLDLLLGLKTYTIAPSVLGKIPGVRKLVKQHEGLLKALGIDKELKRLGVDEPDKDKEETNQGEIKRTPVTVILKLTGQASSPDVVPVLESTLSKDTAVRIKSLLN